MTSCAECLTLLSAARLSELNQNTVVVEHCRTCERCAGVAAEIRYAEQRLALTLAESRPVSPWYVVASEAITGSDKLRRRTAARLFRGVVALFGLALLTSYFREEVWDLKEEVWDRRGPPVISSTVTLRCTNADAAIAVVTPLLRQSGASVSAPPGFPSLILRGQEPDVMQAISALDAFESRFCGIPEGTGKQPATPADATPGKD